MVCLMLRGLKLVSVDRSLSHALDKIDAGVNADLFSHQFAEHLRFCFNTLRFYKMEKVTPPACGVSKVASLLRHATTAELVIINDMTEKIELQEVRAESVTRQPSLSPACSPLSSPACSPRSSQGDSSEKSSRLLCQVFGLASDGGPR